MENLEASLHLLLRHRPPLPPLRKFFVLGRWKDPEISHPSFRDEPAANLLVLQRRGAPRQLSLELGIPTPKPSGEISILKWFCFYIPQK
jgi:hypothetical protein